MLTQLKKIVTQRQEINDIFLSNVLFVSFSFITVNTVKENSDAATGN